MLGTLKWLALDSRAVPDYLDRISTTAEWTALCASHGYHTVARTETVKVIIDLQHSNRTYFFNSRKWETHFGFVQRHINPRADSERFVIQEYTRDDRRFILSAITHYADGSHWTVELSSGDTLDSAKIVWMFEHLRARFGLAVDLRFRPVSPFQNTAAEEMGDALPLLSRDAINATIEYQPIVLGTAYGHLRIVRGALDISSVRPYDIVVTEEVPDAIPPVAALVTSQLQAPLAHVAILSHNRNTPDMAVRGACDLDAFKRLEGSVVKLTVAGQDYVLERANQHEAEAAWAATRPTNTFRPERDLVPQDLVDLQRMPTNAIRFVGAKAAQIGQLNAIDGIRTPGGFAVPFSAYCAHLESADATQEIEAMLSDLNFQGDATIRSGRLAATRAVIQRQAVDPAILESIATRIRASGQSGRWILRSSTNAEDLAGFNGAGLYESVTVPPNPTAQQVADALRFVWASVWLQRAFEEREWYRIDHAAVAMAVLIQPYVEDAVATGVAITGNPFKQGLRAVFVNSQTVGSSVTGALGNELPEQYLVATWTGVYEAELISHSSLTNGAPIMSETDLFALTAQLLRIHDTLLPAHAPGANAMDVEFVLDRERRFTVVQARPYTIVYNFDRARPGRKKSWVDRAALLLRKVIYEISPRRLLVRSRA